MEGKRWKWRNLLPWNWMKCCNDRKPSLRHDSEVDIPTDERYLITEPISFLIWLLKIWLWLINNSTVFGKELVLKEQKSQLNFSTFVTNKDFLSWLFGQSNQNNYVLLAGTKKYWNKVSHTETYHPNRLYKAVHKDLY